MREASANFDINLGNGQGLSLVSVDSSETWLRKFASIMELSPSNGRKYSRIIFSRKGILEKGELRANTIPGLPLKGWSKEDIKEVTLWRHSQTRDSICELNASLNGETGYMAMQRIALLIFGEAQTAGGAPIHAALIQRDSVSVLLAGRGNMGKTTCCRRVMPPWKALCDDMALIIPHDDKFLVHPFPTWSSYIWKISEHTWQVEKFVSLSAIFFLRQSPSDHFMPLSREKATALIYDALYQAYEWYMSRMDSNRQKPLKVTLLDASCQLASKVPAHILEVSLKGKFWQKIEQALGL